MRRLVKSGQLERRLLVILLLIAALSFGSGTSNAQEPTASPKPPSGTAGPSAAEKYFTDVVLVNQNGEKMRFYSDLLRGKVVIINSFFATCTGSCLPLNRNLEKVQTALGDRLR